MILPVSIFMLKKKLDLNALRFQLIFTGMTDRNINIHIYLAIKQFSIESFRSRNERHVGNYHHAI